MKNSNGDVLENRMTAKPVEYLHGSGNIMPALENGLTGLEAGCTTCVTISNQVDIQLDSSFHFDVIIDNVRLATEEEILKGKPVKMVKEETGECAADCICYTVAKN